MERKLRTIFPPDPNPRKPRLSLPVGACDTHFHVFAPPDLYPYSPARGYNPSMAPIEHYLAVAEVLGIERAVIVHPLRVYGCDYRATLAALDHAKDKLRGMRAIITADAGDPELGPADLERLHERGVRGIRLNFTRAALGAFNGDLLQQVVRRVSFLGWAVELHIDSDFIAQHARLLRDIRLPVIFDQFAHLSGLDDPARDTVLDLLRRGNFWVKMFGADRMLLKGARFDAIVALAQALIDAAPDRMIWGSDWPHTQRYQPGQTPNDGDLVDMLLEFAPDEGVRNRILVENPANLFGFA
jgi:2-pyrone-4,6-dicarboxylate lactonase